MKTLFSGFIVLCLFFFSLNVTAQFVERQQLIGTGGVVAQLQGQSVAITKDGMTAVVGGSSDSSGFGAVWVYTRTGSTWTQQGPKLVPNDGVHSTMAFLNFGQSVAISADGNIILVGGSGDTNYRGAAWIFTRSGNTWTQQGSKLVGTGLGPGMNRFGYAVSLSDDGNTALIGAYTDNGAVGSSFIFIRSGNTWIQQGPKIVPPANTHIELGRAVSLSADGRTALIGGPAYRGTGAIFLFKLIGNNWSQDTILRDSISGFNGQGIQVKLSADGNTAVMATNPIAGAATIYRYNGSVWLQEARLLVSGNIGNSYAGRAIGLSSGGDTLALGGWADDNDKGAVWLYTRSNGVWAQLGSKIVPTNPGRATAEFGKSVSLSGNGKLLLIGSPRDVAPTGKVYFYADSTFSLVSSVAERESMNLKLYPNPVQEELNIVLPDISETSTVYINDATGRKQMHQTLSPGKHHTLNLAQLPAGVYIVSVQNTKQVQHFRVVKE